MQIAVLDDYGSVAECLTDWTRLGERARFTFFSERIAEDDLVRTLESFDGIVLTRERTALPGPVIARLPRLRLIVTTGKGNSKLDMVAARAAGIMVCGTVTMGHPTAELVWGLVIAHLRQIPRAESELASGLWFPRMGENLAGKTFGILGLGRIGGKVARIAKAFDMDVIAWSQNLTADHAESHGVCRVTQDELLERSDILSVHVGLQRYRNAIGAAQLRQMKPTALLVNTARAGIVDEDALAEAITEGWIGGAAIDVYPVEPPPPHMALLHMPQVLATPHLGYATRDNLGEGYRQVVECIEGYLDGTPIRSLLPKES